LHLHKLTLLKFNINTNQVDDAFLLHCDLVSFIFISIHANERISVKNNKKVKYQKFFYLRGMQFNSNPFLARPFLIVAGTKRVLLDQAFLEKISPYKSY